MERFFLYFDMRPNMRNPFRVAELYETIDGTRTRVTHKSFATQAEAIFFINSIETQTETETK
jgi:hypothetical protein